MYKKVLLFVIAIMSFSSSIFAQCDSCVALSGANLQVAPYYVGGKYVNGFYPNPSPFVCANQTINETIQVVMPLDTVVTIGVPTTLRFTDWEITGITNIPAGLSFRTMPGFNTKFNGPNTTTPATACAVICGTPTSPNTISDSVSIAVNVKVGLAGTQSSVIKYRVQVGNCGVSNDKPNTANINVYPNPITEKTIFSYELIENSNVEIKLIDMTGKLIKSTSMQQGPGLQTINIFDDVNVKSGIYLLNAKINDKVYTVRVIMN